MVLNKKNDMKISEAENRKKMKKRYKRKKRNKWSHIETHFPILNLLAHTDKATRACLLENMNSKTFNIVCECLHNLQHNHSDYINEQQKHVLQSKIKKGDKLIIRKILNKKEPLHKKRHKAVQAGGSLALIMATLIPVLGKLIFGK